MSVISIRSIVLGALFGAAQQYFAAFPMVGANFALPGEFTFGVICLIGLVASTFAALTVAGTSTVRQGFQAILGGVVVLLLTASLFDAAYDPIKMYFIYGLFFSFMILVALVWTATRRVSDFFLQQQVPQASTVFAFAVPAALLVAYLIGRIFLESEDALRFIRMQLYLGGTAYVLSAIALLVVARVSARARLSRR